MTDKITSIAQLKKAISEIEFYEFLDYGIISSSLEELIIKKISEFEASVKDAFEQVEATERENLDKLPKKLAIQIQSGWLLGYADCWNKLRRILGVGDRP